MNRRPIDSYLRIFAVVIAVSLLAAGLPSAQPANPKLAVHFIDVGQADAVLIVDEARSCVILIDSGEARSKASKENLRTYLQKSLPANGTITSPLRRIRIRITSAACSGFSR